MTSVLELTFREVHILSISSEQVSCIDLVLNIFKNHIVPIRNNGIAAFLESINIINNERSEK